MEGKEWTDCSSLSVELSLALAGVRMFFGGVSREWEKGSCSCSVCWMWVQTSRFVRLLIMLISILQGNPLVYAKDVCRSKS